MLELGNMGSAHLSIWCSPRQSVRFIECMKEDHKMKWSLCLKIDLNVVIVMKGLYMGGLYFLYLFDMPLFM